MKRKESLSLFFGVLALQFCVAQSNTFPTTGNFGIGTSSPTKSLEVIGIIKGDEFNFPVVQYSFTSAQRTQLNRMSIKLFYYYNTNLPRGVSLDTNSYSMLLEIYGLASDWQTDLYFGASDRKMYFRPGVYANNCSENNGARQFKNWRTVLDSHSDVKSSGKLYLTGTGNHIVANGKFGIGTDLPKEKLSVNGKIRVHEVKIETANWPDYVFKSDYNLPSLSETEQFIHKNRHLLESPKAPDV